jgi:hypothetical protein
LEFSPLIAEIEVMLTIKNLNLTLLIPDERIAAKITHMLLAVEELPKGSGFEAIFRHK